VTRVVGVRGRIRRFIYNSLFNRIMVRWATNLCEWTRDRLPHYVSDYHSCGSTTDEIRQFYYLNMNVVVGVSLGLVATRLYDALDSVTVQFLLTAYFEYYYFIQTVKRTNHIMDALSPLALGIIQGFAIYSLGKGGSVSNLWWIWEFFYVLSGIVLLVHSWLHIEVSDLVEDGRPIISQTIILSVAMCLTLEAVIIFGYVVTLLDSHPFVELALVLLSLIAGTGTAKSFIFLHQWERSSQSALKRSS
jgi:hypothetical protein